jgi:hypothetical protein
MHGASHLAPAILPAPGAVDPPIAKMDLASNRLLPDIGNSIAIHLSRVYGPVWSMF